MVLDKARELGLALSESPEFQRMAAARAILDTDTLAFEALNTFKEKQSQLVELLSSEEPDRLIVAALSKEVEDLQNTLLSNPVFAEAMAAQNEFQSLMNKVNSEIAICIGMEEAQAPDCSGGSCEGCPGCN
ncbi:YlbF family regulator [Eubacteriales bacterium OttesenSCG-928-K08]|nr:YlbF family regulator [Eubacteriales bacterium OttesenSCG-928-K08]